MVIPWQLVESGLAIGSGITDSEMIVQALADYAWSMGLVNIKQRDEIRVFQEKCVKDIQTEDWFGALENFGLAAGTVLLYAGINQVR